MASSSTAMQNQAEPENAFPELAPYSAPKSTEPWNIFINHYGRDVKHTLASSIYRQLHSLGFHVFLDKEALLAGDCIPAELQHAIHTATLHIAIFSPNYAKSPWCLSELSFMLKSRGKVIPIFYRVDPFDLRYIEEGKGEYAPAFSEHEKKGRYTPEKLGEWKSALRQSSFQSGFLVEDEATVLKNIVNRVYEVMKKTPLWVVEHPQALDERVEGFKSVAREDTVSITGIVGMGGSGKTTLAKEIFNRNFPSFQKCSFVFDVRDAASKNTLPEKQKQLLADLSVHHSGFHHVDQGKAILSNHLSDHRVLIVLDDVDHIDHLNALLPNKNNLGSQSMVIVTTRELGVLISWGLSSIYNIPPLAQLHAKQLFCWHAFLQPSPPAEFETLVEEFIKACNGLPLSLKVLGAQLYGRKSKDYWKSQLHKILRTLPGEIKQTLQVSYDALDEEERMMFLDVACFFIGEEKSTAIAVWDGSGWSGLLGLETLVNKCLVELVGREKIRMHDHLRDMGREIARSQSPYRLWCEQEIDNMKKHSKRRRQIRGIQPADAFVAFKQYTHWLMENSSKRSKRLRFSNELQILSVEGNELTEEFASLTEDLVWLRWKRFPLRNLPSWLTLKNLRVLELHGATQLEGLWQDNADHPPLQLRELILRDCRKLQWLPSSTRRLQYLKRPVAEFLGNSLSEEFCGLQSLECLQLHSPVLSFLPADFGNFTSLRNISLSSHQMSMLPDSFSQLIHLEILDLSSCTRLSSLPTDFGNLTSLRNINMGSCKQLNTFPDSFSQLIHLEDLDLSRCEMLSSLPAGFGNLKNLRIINLQFCQQLSMLPDSFSELIHLEVVNLTMCGKLSSLPAGFGNLKSLRIINLDYCMQLSMLPDSFSKLIHLEVLDLYQCEKLSSLPSGFGNLTSLRRIKLDYCKQLNTLTDSFSWLIHLTYLRLSRCEKLSSLPAGFGSLTNLRELHLDFCDQLSSLPSSFEQLTHLETFEVRSLHLAEIETLPVSLKTLSILYCNLLKNIRCVSGLIKLEELIIEYCFQIEELPSFAELASLNSFTMRYCPQIEKIEGLEEAKSLKWLDIDTRWKVSGIQSLRKVGPLERLRLHCETISAMKPCIQSIKGKECPKYMSIKGSVICSVEHIVNSLNFPDLEVRELQKGGDVDHIPWTRGLDALLLYIEVQDKDAKERKVVTIVYRERESHLDYFLSQHFDYRVVEKRAVVAGGRRGRVAEAFYQLLQLLT